MAESKPFKLPAWAVEQGLSNRHEMVQWQARELGFETRHEWEVWRKDFLANNPKGSRNERMADLKAVERIIQGAGGGYETYGRVYEEDNKGIFAAFDLAEEYDLDDAPFKYE